ncbi:MAG: peptide chain release factor 2 [Oscillospiraceae bacterium]
MILLDDLKQELENYRPKLDELYEVLDIAHCSEEAETLKQESAAPEFWNDNENSQKVLKKIKTLENTVAKYAKLRGAFEDTLTLIALAGEEDDTSLIPEIREEIAAFQKAVDEVTLSTLLTGEYDACSAIVSFHAGAGGTEAQDWAEMLFRMYTRWGERRGYKVKTLDYLDGNDAGIKSAAIIIEGENAYGYLKSEAGIHRLVRISPFDSSGSRHTSFAALDVMPELDESFDVDIRAEDIEVDTYRASGAGGQHINKTDSAVRITHLPTGIVCACQTQRSQHQNRDYAMKMLKAKLVEIKEREHLDKIEDIKGVQKEIAWGAQIRSYVFMPYTLAKDHRTGFESGNIGAVMDGEIDGFINAYLKAASLGNRE